MPRANRHFLPGYVWHITHRCHKKEFLLKFAKDRKQWIYWLYQARKRYKLCVLNYTVTSNHIHLLVKDVGGNNIPKSMQLIASRTAQAYNQRKNRKGAFWEDRYHATAIETESHFSRCQAYIDLNMVRAGAVKHPREWPHCGYQEIVSPPKRYRILDYEALIALAGTSSFAAYQEAHTHWTESVLASPRGSVKDTAFSSSVALGQKAFVENVLKELGVSARGRQIVGAENGYQIREELVSYGPHLGSKK